MSINKSVKNTIDLLLNSKEFQYQLNDNSLILLPYFRKILDNSEVIIPIADYTAPSGIVEQRISLPRISFNIVLKDHSIYSRPTVLSDFPDKSPIPPILVSTSHKAFPTLASVYTGKFIDFYLHLTQDNFNQYIEALSMLIDNTSINETERAIYAKTIIKSFIHLPISLYPYYRAVEGDFLKFLNL